jgi:predicted DNA-binding transcriptional regulator AlpA
MQDIVTEEPTLDELQPLLLNSVQFGRLLSVSKDTIKRMDASGKIPAPIRFSKGTVRWRYKELQAWCDAGCPNRKRWEAIRCNDDQKSVK